jgi:DNA-binding NarL/FixJ family response regulator
LLEIGERMGASVMLSFLAMGWLGQGDPTRAKRLAERGLGLAPKVGNTQATYIAFYVRAMVAQAEGDHEYARRLLKEGLKLSAEAGDETNVAYCVEGLAAIAASQGRIVCAARLWGAAEVLLEAIEVVAYIYAPDRSLSQSQVTAARARLDDEAAWEVAWAEGRAMTSEQVIEYALLEEEEGESPTLVPVPEQPPAGEPTERLTHREQEVSVLIGRGLTNRRIAEELVLSEHTATTHVRAIRKKLGLHSRVQIAAWVVEQQPLP